MENLENKNPCTSLNVSVGKYKSYYVLVNRCFIKQDKQMLLLYFIFRRLQKSIKHCGKHTGVLDRCSASTSRRFYYQKS